MMERFEVSGLFTVEVEAKDNREAEAKARRILYSSGITGHVLDANKKEDIKDE
jgi:hypothetical protein